MYAKQPVVRMLGTSINRTEESFDIVCYFLFPGISTNGSKLVKLCGDHLDQPTKKPTYSIGNEMTIVFRSDNNTNHYRGFLVSVQPGKNSRIQGQARSTQYVYKTIANLGMRPNRVLVGGYKEKNSYTILHLFSLIKRNPNIIE